MIVDLHQDISVELLENGVSHFINSRKVAPNKTREFSRYGVVSQTDLVSLRTAGVHLVVGASCGLKINSSGIYVPTDPLAEVMRHINSYTKLIRSSPAITQVKTIQDMENLDVQKLNIILSIEGLYFINSSKDVALIDKLFIKGIRMVGPMWNIKNKLGGGTNSKSGLTKLGREVISKLNSKDIVIDLTHSSQKTFDDVVSISTKPAMVSHTLSTSAFDISRNITDDQIKKICGQGGIIGICLVKDFLGDEDPKYLLRHIKHMLKVGSSEAICIGSDLGALTKSQQIKGMGKAQNMSYLIELLRKSGLKDRQVENILNKNATDFLKENLPSQKSVAIHH